MAEAAFCLSAFLLWFIVQFLTIFLGGGVVLNVLKLIMEMIVKRNGLLEQTVVIFSS